MGRINALTYLFNTGEVSLAALNRVDKEALRLYAERQENLLPYSIGKAIMRPGTQFLDEAYNGNFTRLLPFVKGIDDTALIEMSGGALRIRVDDEIVSRDAVEADITSGDFDSATGWTTATTAGGVATIANGVLTLSAPVRGGSASCSQEVSTDSVGEIHALRLDIQRGPVTLRVGASSGGDEYIGEVALDSGIHSLAFEHTGATSIDSNTVLLLHMDGADTSTTFTDSSDFGHVVTVSGNAQVDTSATKFGTGSAQFDGSGDFLLLDGSADFAFGTDDFTIDFWAYNTSSSARFAYDSEPLGGGAGVYPIIFFNNNFPVYSASDGSIEIYNDTVSQSVFHHIAVVRSSGITTLYVNGVSQGSAADTNNYGNGASRPVIGSSGDSLGSGWAGRIDELRVSKGIARWTENFTPPTSAYAVSSNPDGSSFFITLSSKLERKVIINSIQIEDAGEMVIGAPWNESDLRLIRHAQEEDVIFLACENWQPRKIERRSDLSWSLVKYEAEDGPFTTARTAAVKLSASATRGNVTLTADAAFFRSDHVGALMKLNHEREERSWALGADETVTDAFRIRGILDENSWDVTVSGTFVGTLSEQRSYDGEDTGFLDSGTTITAVGSTSPNPATPEFDNQIIWVRYAFKNQHTSGEATIAVNYPGSGGSGVAKITDFTSSTSVEAEILDDFTAAYATDSWLEGDWSDRRGWPTSVGFFDGRLWWARRSKFWGSESDGYYSFNLDTEGDSGSIQRAIATSGYANETQWILGLQRLILGTNSAPISARSSSFDEPLTPTNLTMKPASTVGAAKVSPIAVGPRGAYVSADGLKLMEIAFNVEAQDYVATDLTRLNEDLAEASNPDLYEDGFVEIAHQQSPAPYLWALREDGVLTPSIFNPQEEARGFFRVITGGEDPLDEDRPNDRIVSIAVLPRSVEDQVYVTVERTIGDGSGGTERAYYIEKFAQHREAVQRVYNSTTRRIKMKNGLKMADSFILATGLGGIGQVITGLDHLEGREVIIVGQLANGGYGPTGTVYTVEDGQITTEEGVEGEICIGLEYAGRYKSAKLAYAGQIGTALTQTKKVNQLGLALINTHPDALRVGARLDDDEDGDEENEMDELPRIRSNGAPYDDDIVLFDRGSEEKPFSFPGEWGTDSRLCIKIRPGYSACLSAVLAGVDTRERTG